METTRAKRAQNLFKTEVEGSNGTVLGGQNENFHSTERTNIITNTYLNGMFKGKLSTT